MAVCVRGGYQSVHHQKSGDGKRKLSDDVCIRDWLLFMCDAAAAVAPSSTIYTWNATIGGRVAYV